MIPKALAMRLVAVLVASYPTQRVEDETIALYVSDFADLAKSQEHGLDVVTKVVDFSERFPSRNLVRSTLKSMRQVDYTPELPMSEQEKQAAIEAKQEAMVSWHKLQKKWEEAGDLGSGGSQPKGQTPVSSPSTGEAT